MEYQQQTPYFCALNLLVSTALDQFSIACHAYILPAADQAAVSFEHCGLLQ